MKKVLLIGLGFLAAVALSLQAEQSTTTIKEGSPSEYVVQKGDTLWAIAGLFLNHPWEWPEIWYNNPQIENPYLIYPNDTIIVSYVNGLPQLSLGKRAYEKISPSIREIDRNEVIVPFSSEIIEDFLLSNQIRSDSEINAAPSVLGVAAGRLYAGAGDEFYVHGLPRETLGRYGVFRQGDSYIDPDSGEILGRHMLRIGVARVVGVEENLATLIVVRSKTAIRRGDRLLREIDHMSANELYPEPTSQLIDGNIIAVENGRNTAGAMDIVALNRGYEEGLEPGNLLDLFTKGERLKILKTDSVINAPDRRIGSLLVFSVYEKMSYGIILQASQQVISGTIVQNPKKWLAKN